MKKQYFIINEGIFNRNVHVFLNYSTKDIDEHFPQKESKSNDANFSAYSFSITHSKTGVTEWGIQLKEFNWTIHDQGTLIHEIVHTIIKIWESNNIPFTPDNQEFLAYSIGNLYEDIAAKIHGIKKKKR